MFSNQATISARLHKQQQRVVRRFTQRINPDRVTDNPHYEGWTLRSGVSRQVGSTYKQDMVPEPYNNVYDAMAPLATPANAARA
jgi:hypothetical protein